MRVLHTSDWHLGRALYGRKRYAEFEQFLNWLHQYIADNSTDVLIVAGDIFDTGSPSNRAQDLYYEFLAGLKNTSCRHIVIVAGNHDSPTFLNAPKSVLRFLNVSVIGAVGDSLSEQIIEIKNDADETQMIVCAVPYLRDRDLRQAEAGESYQDKESKIIQGIKNHYREICLLAEQKQQDSGKKIPIVATGHLFTSGGKTLEADGVRDLYVGSLGQIGNESFPASIDYLALGHLHVPQKVGGDEFRRYCGSPLPMSFGEAKQQKLVLEVEFTDDNKTLTEVNIPTFQKLRQLRGDWAFISAEIEQLKNTGDTAWLEVIYEGKEIIPQLSQQVREMAADSKLEILRIQNKRLFERAMKRMHSDESLDQLSELDVFKRCLNQHEIPEEQHNELHFSFQEIVSELSGEE
ncbi:MAG: exonuclease SbcCD subunit D C-terminal domain-containing protein [Lentisphaeraceae bacterium]|nr:exonuclease SbcCD subunit D C-terminal domain-containing protein [Lentisphaeraceae bacterium]